MCYFLYFPFNWKCIYLFIYFICINKTIITIIVIKTIIRKINKKINNNDEKSIRKCI